MDVHLISTLFKCSSIVRLNVIITDNWFWAKYSKTFLFGQNKLSVIIKLYFIIKHCQKRVEIDAFIHFSVPWKNPCLRQKRWSPTLLKVKIMVSWDEISFFMLQKSIPLSWRLVWIRFLNLKERSSYDFIPNLNTQSCINGLLLVRDFCFWAARPVIKTISIMNYFFMFSWANDFFFKCFYISVSALKSCIISL